MKNKSDVNISVFTETPHGRRNEQNADSLEGIKDKLGDKSFLEYIKRKQKNTAFKAETGLPDNWRGKTVIEFGCGAGMKILPFALKGANVIGIDGSSVQIERIKKNAENLKVKGEFILSKLEEIDINKLPKADLIICSAVIHHVHEWSNVLQKICETTDANGYIYLTWGDWTIHLSGFNLKNQIAYRLGWNNKSRLFIGMLLFGWWDKNRNKQNIEKKSFFADLYSAYYILLSYKKIKNELKKNGIQVMNAIPPNNLSQFIKTYELAGKNSKILKIFKNINNSPFSFLGTIIIKLRYYFQPKHGPRIISAKKI